MDTYGLRFQFSFVSSSYSWDPEIICIHWSFSQWILDAMENPVVFKWTGLRLAISYGTVWNVKFAVQSIYWRKQSSELCVNWERYFFVSCNNSLWLNFSHKFFRYYFILPWIQKRLVYSYIHQTASWYEAPIEYRWLITGRQKMMGVHIHWSRALWPV